mgnify:CR=1 FL=1
MKNNSNVSDKANKTKKKIIGNKKILIILLLIILAVIAAVMTLNRKEITGYLNEQIKGIGENVQAAEEVGEKGKITSAQIIQTKTGTGPWDENDEPGNDSSEDNKIVRSFDQVTWTVDVTMALKEGITETGLTGGVINVEVSLPENCANVMKWDISSMNWLENGEVSSDGRTLTGKYSMSEEGTTIPGKQTLVFVLQVEGAGNETKIIPTFNFKLEGNEETEKVTISGETITVSAKGKYNIQMVRNTGLAFKTTVDYGEGDKDGRMYGYNFVIQLYNENESKGLKGIEYPKGEITFDINLQLQRSKFGSSDLEDITKECTPVLWQYRLNDWTNNSKGLIEGRDLLVATAYHRYNPDIPLGIYVNDKYSTYDSGDINIVQEGSKLKVTVNNYDFNGTFPHYECNYSGAQDSGRKKIYTENIGTFSIGYMQIFVPDNEASTVEDRNYYLTVSDSNLKMTSITNQNITIQMDTSDDSPRVEHVLYKPGNYFQQIINYDKATVTRLESYFSEGDGKAVLGQELLIATKFITSTTNDDDIYTANRFLKFDGEAFEPIYHNSNKDKYVWNSPVEGNPKFRLWYVTKKDGTNWTSQSEMNNANIEDMDVYDYIEDIPENKICVGMYVELVDGYIFRAIGTNGNHLFFPLKVKDTAKIGKTYGITQRTILWAEKLDRDIYSVLHPENEYPTPTWDSGNPQYVKTEYDENGEIIAGTNSGGFYWGNTILITGANLHGSIQAIDENQKEKVNYDLGKNEDTVTYKVEPQLDGNSNLKQQISGVTLKAEVTLPKGLTYIVGSSKRGDKSYTEPEITDNTDGTQKLTWYIYGCTSGTAIEPITFEAQIDNESANGTQYEAKFVVSEVIGSDGITKIGNSEINFRTSTEAISIINLASHRLYKEVETPVIEKNGQIKYTIVYANNTDETVPEFQLLDILPYNGDNRGTEFAGTYTLESVKVNQTISGTAQATSNLKLYTTNAEEVRNMTAKDEGIGTDSIWSEKTIGNTLNESAKGMAIKGELAGRARLEIEITLNTNGNEVEDVYGNNGMAQVYTDSEQMQTGIVQAQVVNRKIEGKVWEDSNANGIIDNNETGMEGIKIKLINTESQGEKETTTREDGTYEFVDVERGKYKVEIEEDEYYELTEKGIGDNIEINSKFNKESRQTDEIETLNSEAESPVIVEENVNAGLVRVKYDINTEVDGEGGTITGQDEEIYETVDKGEDSKKDIVITPNYGYRVSKITVNGEEIEYTEEENHKVTLNKFVDMQEDKTVVVSFERIEGEIITHHYIEGTSTKVPSNVNGQVVEDVRQTGYVGETYETKKAENIANNYEYVSIKGNASGEIVEGTQEVIYYYKLKTPEITNTEITKESSIEKVTNPGQVVDYTVNYKTTINTYIGKATITIVDELPYEIDESKAYNLDEGTYSKENKIITWTEEIGEIDTFVNGAKGINIEKEISLVYKDVDTTINNISNKVTGTVNLETPEKEETTETTKDIPAEFLINIPVEKVWDDEENTSHRPESVTVQLTADGENVDGKTAVLNEGNGWKTTFENLLKYDTTGKEISYSVVESETNPGDLEYYDDAKVENVEGTVRVTNSYKEMNSNIDSNIEKVGTEEITSSTQEVSYEINYNATVTDYIGEGKVTIVDYLPYAIDEGKSNIANGTYNSEDHTITWVEDIGHINTYEEGQKEVSITKEIRVVFSGLDASRETITNNVEGKLQLDTTEETTKNEEVTQINIVGNVVAKYLEEGTNNTLAPEEKESGKVGTSYSTEQKDIVGYDFVRIEGNASGNYVEGTIEVIYYYKLKDPIITTPVVTKESSVEKVTTVNQSIDYAINYKTILTDYKGKATVTIVDELPYEIDESKAYSLDGGTYSKENKTITWTEEIGEIDTFVNGAYNVDITKEISLVYKDIDVTKTNVTNKVKGTIKLETPEKEETTETTKDIPAEYLVNIIVNKIWKDNETQSARRPESIILVVKNGEQEVKTQEITKNDMVEGTTNQWSTTIEGLEKYDENGEEIKYTVEEREKTEGDLKFYEAEETTVTVEDNQATIRNSFVKPEDTTSVEVTKVWNDNNNVNGRRPESIIVKVTGNGETRIQEINATDNTSSEDQNSWTYTFTGLPKYDENGQEIVYTVSEEAVNTNDLKFYTTQVGNVTNIENETDKKEATITNTFTVPDERIDLTVNKVWKDNTIQSNRRPETIVINVKAENSDVYAPDEIIATYELNTETETSYTFTDLPKYNSKGQEIEYTVEEQEKAEGDLKFYTPTIGRVTNVENEENKKEVTITNTFKKPEEKTEITVTKVWDDNSDEAQKRPTSIKLQLKNGNKVVKEQEVNESNSVQGNTNTWQYTFAEIEKYNENGEEIVYTADETEVNNNDLQFYSKATNGLTVTNTFTQDTTKVNIPVTKIWEDNEIQRNRRPESVIIVLKRNGEEERRYELSEETAETVEGNEWSYIFKDLPKYDQNNNIIQYTIEEKEKNAGDLKFYTTNVDGYRITNTFTRPTETISIEVNKEWEDQENIYEKRPTSVRLEIKMKEENQGTGSDTSNDEGITNETVVANKVVTKENNWKATFTGLQKYDENGQEIEYKVDEEEVLPNDLFYYEKEIGEVTEKEGTTNEKEATITNKMVKIPGTVVVKYVDKNTGEEVSERRTKEGIVGDTFDVTEDVKEIEGYTLVGEPEEKTGTYTAKEQEKIYYYAKNTRVIVKYLEEDDTPEDISNNKVLAEEKIMLGYEGESYSTISEDIEGYTLVDKTDNTSGVMQREEIVVIYYYAQNTKVTVKYLEKDDTPNDNSDNKVVATEKVINGHVGQEYKTQEEIVPGYTLVEKTNNEEGTMTKEEIEVIYYYAQNTKVTVKYLEKDNTPEDITDNQVLADEIEISGYEGKDYETEEKKIENYTFVESTNNTKGTMTKEEIEVIYYYAQNTKAKVQHIDRETGEILKEETKNGKVGDIFETQAEDFEGYVLVESPEEANIIMDKTGEQVVKYYYAHISAGVIEKHIDEITGELIESSEHEGNEGDYYNVPSKEFEGYDLVTEDKEGNSKLPTNAEGEMKKDEVIEVKYYYIKKAKVIIKYLEEDDTPEDTTDNKEIAEEEIIEGHENDEYTTEAKEIKDYNLVETPENSKGTMTVTKNPDGSYDTEIEVIYYYKRQAGGVIENHIDITTDKKLATEEHEGNVGDSYDIPSREFEGYDLVTEDKEGNNRLPENSKGTMTEEKIEVNYYYIKRAKVKVEYIDKLTGEKLDEEEIVGHVGDEYTTEEKEFEGYDLVEKPSNSRGEMTEETVVKYYYERKSEVEVKYIEKGTEYEISASETIEGYVGDSYETEQKEIPYYKFVEKTENSKGTMQEEKITVKYYYEKQVFNLSVDKWVSSVNVDGINSLAQNINSSNEIYKVDIHRSKTQTADIKITYKIRVTNKGEIEGKVGEIVEIIPEGYSYYEEDNSTYWEERNGSLVTDALKEETIQAGQYKEVEIVLRWNKGEENFGQKDNMVMLSEIENPAGYEDIDRTDNNDTSSMIITIATGLDRNDRIIIIGVVQIVLAITIGLLLSYKKKRD